MASHKARPALTHVREDGTAHMVDVSGKAATARVAVAEGVVRMSRASLRLLAAGASRKGDVLAVARVAGIMGAKRTAELIPLCHPVALTHVAVDLVPDRALPGVRVRAEARTTGQTGVEMEALAAVTCAALTVYDMMKAVERGMTITDVGLTLKEGGRSGRWERGAALGRRG
ncbi:MAG: cyclic pyranopterin monophosphate synthase MoaC [Deltaproteobacteria bacterium]|nr:cyclic pyranopterin monophosphate synthase MoaC [Deltaproteobacteria bacterium]